MSPGVRAAASVSLPPPRLQGECSVERALHERRTRRDFASGALTLAEIGQLLWAGQGITARDGLRAAPSAGALYPLDLDLVAGRVDGIAAGVYRYRPEGHALVHAQTEDLHAGSSRRPAFRGTSTSLCVALAAAAYGQEWIGQAAVVLIISAVEARTTGKYGPRGLRYVAIEAGHAAQNVLLQAVALGLAAGVAGAFDDEQVARLLQMGEGQQALYLIPVGRR